MTFGTLGYGPQARSVLHCNGVLALRGGPLPGAVQDGAAEVRCGDGNARDGGEGENAGKVLGKASCDPNMMGKTEENIHFQ